MNGKKPSPGVATSARDHLGEWRELLERCGRKPTRKRVHALRVVTLRLQAELEHNAAGLPSASHQAQAMLRFGKQSGKLRHALGRVREIDVWIGKLRRLQASMSETVDYIPRSTRDCARQIDRMEERLQQKRNAGEKKLIAEIEKRRDALLTTGKDVDVDLEDRKDDPHAFEHILAGFAEATAAFPELNPENLHEFRKRIKTVRYLAELSCADPACGKLAAQMKKVQTAIGEWHDWDSLARVVPRGKHGKNGQLAELLDTIAAEAFQAAVATCHSTAARLVDSNGTRGGATPPAVRRKQPVRSENGPVDTRAKKLA